MCGISGIVGQSKAFEAEKEIGRILESVAHRGPDHQAIYSDRNSHVYFGHARLSIQDLSHSGDQPMESADGRYVIVFNGEIYNYQELASRLEKEYGPVEWKGHSDTEVLLAVISVYGLRRALRLIDGMYAFALFDRKARVVHLVGDLYGEKPLYYSVANGALMFASDFGYFATSDHIDKSLDPLAVASYLDNKYIPAPRTIFNSVRKMAPGQMVSCSVDSPARCEQRRYYRIDEHLESRLTVNEISREEAEQEIERRLSISISRRLLSDRPIGALLSSGVDSSLVCALAARQGGRDLTAYTVAFGQGLNEAEAAEKFARKIGVDHQTVSIENFSVEELATDLPSIYTEPFADPSQVPTTLISRTIKHSLDVVLTGDAADELFGGYRRYFHIRDRLSRLEKFSFLLRGLGGMLGPISGLGRTNWVRAAKILGEGNIAEKYCFLHSLKMSSQLLIPQWQQVVGEGPCQASEAFLGKGGIETFMALDLQNYLPGDILVKLDRASMSVALEGRIPFLSRDIVEFSLQIPPQYLYGREEGKCLLKSLLKKKTGVDLAGVRKKGFSVPLVQWLQQDLSGWLEKHIQLAIDNPFGMYRKGAIEKMYRAFRRQPTEPMAHRLWVIANLEQWFNRYLYRQ